jgi:hypothetical protein
VFLLGFPRAQGEDERSWLGISCKERDRKIWLFQLPEVHSQGKQYSEIYSQPQRWWNFLNPSPRATGVSAQTFCQLPLVVFRREGFPVTWSWIFVLVAMVEQTQTVAAKKTVCKGVVHGVRCSGVSGKFVSLGHCPGICT